MTLLRNPLFSILSYPNDLLNSTVLFSAHHLPDRLHILDLVMYQIRIVNIRADEIVDGNPKLTLGLIWIIILHFHVSIPANYALKVGLPAFSPYPNQKGGSFWILQSSRFSLGRCRPVSLGNFLTKRT